MQETAWCSVKCAVCHQRTIPWNGHSKRITFHNAWCDRCILTDIRVDIAKSIDQLNRKYEAIGFAIMDEHGSIKIPLEDLDEQLQMGSHKYWIVTFDNKTEKGAEHRVPGDTEQDAIATARNSLRGIVEAFLERFPMEENEKQLLYEAVGRMPVRSCIKATIKNFWPPTS